MQSQALRLLDKGVVSMANSWRLNGFYDVTKLTGLFEAAQRRESCRAFAAAPDAAQWNELLAAADTLAMPGVRIALGLCENSLFSPVIGSLFVKFENVQRFAAVIVTDATPESVVNAGVSGEMFLLRAVETGLAGCWVSGTYRRGQVGLKTGPNERIVALLALGRPKKLPDLPIRRKRKDIFTLCPQFDVMPSVLKGIAQYIQIAPSAVNLQPWRMKLLNGTAVSVSVGAGAQRLDLGIGLCHALLALGNTPALFSLAADGLSATLELL
jgi:nitroreductase